jgi:hypothetical protein
VLNVVLGLVSLAFAVGIVRTLVVKHPLPSAGVPRPMAASAPAAGPATADAGPDTYAMIAAQNLFNPARSETATAAAAVNVVKPILHGVVIQAGTSRAFLEDPSAKRVGGYSVGDTIGGGKIQRIADDRVVIARPEGMVEVLLQDPSKPRPAPTAAGVIAGQGQIVPGMPAAPGQIAPGQFGPGQPAPGQPAPGQFAPVQVGPGQPVPGQPAQITRPNPEASPTVPQGPPSQNRRRSSPQGQAGNE